MLQASRLLVLRRTSEAGKVCLETFWLFQSAKENIDNEWENWIFLEVAGHRMEMPHNCRLALLVKQRWPTFQQQPTPLVFLVTSVQQQK